MTTDSQGNTTEQRRKPGPKQYLLLIFILVILPGISWFYLKYGLEYQIKVRAELHNFGQIAPFSFPEFNQDSLGKKLTLINFAEESFTATEGTGLAFSKLHHQFDQSPEIRFVSILPFQDSSRLNAWAFSNQSNDPAQWKIIGADSLSVTSWRNLIAKQAHISAPNASLIFVSDIKGALREVYDLQKDNETKLLIEHVAMLAPRDSVLQVEVKPKGEK